ncbi:hypothetical protein H2198_007111 [Neophaeococcomyces mojaviensis]|uniref:Uncharacterized protein n=1 Tax=Neophaeococcomyces mojaviensis TaxID=3383035 RepID=A0ACC3A106_9EURO|nr:hypothetical protein H2198_007111 [Knufia sp. JES_112]
MMAAPLGVTALGKSNLTRQLEHEDGSVTPKSNKTRSLSEAPKPSLSPSPAIREPYRRVSKDDSSVADPITPRRPVYHVRGLSLQMPTKDSSESGTVAEVPRIPLSPKLDPSSIYGSPASTIPRRSRGLDFARACTSLHHSTLAESSPDASPITGRGINIPQRRGLGYNSSISDSPSHASHSLWSNLNGEKTNLSSSVSSINMMDSDSDSDDSSEDMAIDREMDDPMLNTPAAAKINGLAAANSPGMDWLNNHPSNAQVSLLSFQPHRMSFRRTRLRHGKSSHSSSSVSMRSSKASPGPLSPPIRPSVEASGYFGMTKQQVRSRRESLSLGTDDLHLSDSEWDGDNKMNINNTAASSGNDGSSERGVIRRAVTRRSNLLPKTKGFARIKAALMEESDPLHTEARREAEVIKQVQESDPTFNGGILESTTTAEPVEVSVESATLNDDENSESQANDSSSAEPSFSQHAKRNSAGLGFWNTFESTPPSSIDRYRTPPPPALLPQESNMSDDTMVSTSSIFNEPSHTGSLIRRMHRSRSRSTTPLASAAAAQATANVLGHGGQAPTAGDVARKVNNKRRRDDDFDPASFKRRAVSPGMSAQSSPVVPQSPVMNPDKSWGRPPSKSHADRSNSGGSVSANGGTKRVGLQGMTEANEGFMGMSID